MGYYSDVTIAVTKELYVKAVLLNNIPNALTCDLKRDTATNVYWQIMGWKWYQSNRVIKEIEDWFEWCEEQSTRTDIDHIVTHYGAIRIGEEYGDRQEWGSPQDFDIYVNHYISDPF